MALLALGLIMVLAGAAIIRYPELAQDLAQHDERTWQRLGKPGGFGAFDLGGTIALHNWIIVRGYEKSASKTVQALGAKMRERARLAQFSLLSGCALMVVGFVVTLATV